MNSYTDIDGVPVGRRPRRCSPGCCARRGASTGTVVADYFAVAFLKLLHGVGRRLGRGGRAGARGRHRRRAADGQGLRRAAPAGGRGRRGRRGAHRPGARRVLRQKAELGLLDADWSAGAAGPRGRRPRDARVRCAAPSTSTPPANRDARAARSPRRRSCCSPTTARCRSRAPASHRGDRPERRRPVRRARLLLVPGARRWCSTRASPIGIAHADPARALARRVPGRRDRARAGHERRRRRDRRHSRMPVARGIRRRRVLALGDRAGLFGRGTSGEGCDAESPRRCPARSSGCRRRARHGHARPCSCCSPAGRTRSVAAVDEAAAIVQTFFPGEEGSPAIAGVLSGRVNPSGRLPVSIPRDPGAQPSTYLAAPLARASDVSNIDPTAAFAFGHGLGYSLFEWESDAVDLGRRRRPTARSRVSHPACGNTGDRAAPRSCSCTCTTRWPRSCGPCSGSSVTRGSQLEAGEAARRLVHGARRPRVVHRARRPADRRARRARARLRPLERRHAHRADGAPRRPRAGGRPHARAARDRRSSSRSRSRHPSSTDEPRSGLSTTGWRMPPDGVFLPSGGARAPGSGADYPAGGAVLSRTTRLVARSMRGVGAAPPGDLRHPSPRARRPAGSRASPPPRPCGAAAGAPS